ncbi:MAG: hypothetical protein AAF125_20465 [Chloroflexota bacterium]
MKSRNDIGQDAIHRAEMNALALQTIARIKRGDTVPHGSIYRVLMEELQGRALELGEAPGLPLSKPSDWLAIALFMEDRDRFHAMCAESRAAGDPVHKQALPWLSKMLQHEENVQE